MKLLVATRSRSKLVEIRSILSVVPGLELLDLDDVGIPPDPVEDELEPHDSFAANARSKAAYFRISSELPTVADDSGIVVDVLGGAPGVRSRRFAPLPEEVARDAQDRANNLHLLASLAEVAALEPARRTARYVCVAALDQGEGRVEEFHGIAEGSIGLVPRGDGGFGYDPLFVDPESELTFAELTPEQKHARSHRGKVFRALAQHLLVR